MPTTLSWTTQHATDITFNPAISDEQESALPLSGSLSLSPVQTTTYTATATGKSGSVSQSITIQVEPPLPQISLSASPAVVLAGASTTITWNTANATSLSISGLGSVSLTGSATVTPPATTTYTAMANGAGGVANQSLTVTVTKISITATPDSIAPGQNVTLDWNSPGATSVCISNGGGVFSGPSGSIQLSPTVTTKYVATAQDSSGNTWSNSVVVPVSQAGPGFTKIKHIIFLVNENRSFDNYFGQLGQYRAAHGLANTIDGTDANAVLFDAEGDPVSPYHFQTVCHENLNPGWNASWPDADHGKMDKFVLMGEQFSTFLGNTKDPHGTRAMGYYDWTDLPYYYDLATQFGTSDRFFSPVLAGTEPNRMYVFAATSFGYDNAPSNVVVGGWTQPTIFDRLDQAGISWRYYYQSNSVFLVQFSTWLRDSQKVWNISHWYTDVQNPNSLPQVIFIEHATNPVRLDEHPNLNIQLGAANTQKIIDALMASPSWASSIFIFTYDEGGGLYDHVPPLALPAPDNIPPNSPNPPNGDFQHSGFRLPVIVMSPYSRPNFVSHVGRDSTSILKLIEVRFGAQSLTARDAAADDMTEFFDFSAPAWATPPMLQAQPTNGTCDYSVERAPGY
jgi:phospholipase C